MEKVYKIVDLMKNLYSIFLLIINMKRKKGQLTIFIILAILIIAFVVLFFVFKGRFIWEKPLNPETAEIKNFVQTCSDDSLEEAVFRVGKNGGYRFPENVFEFENSKVTYYLLNEKNYLPSKEQVEQEISDYFDIRLFVCTNYFADFPDYEIEQGNLESSAKILGDKVILKMDYPLAIQKRGSESKSVIRKFETEIPIRLGAVYDSVSEFIVEQEKYKQQGFCLSCLPEDLAENNLFVSVNDGINNTKVFTFRDNSSKLNNKTFEWVFANKY